MAAKKEGNPWLGFFILAIIGFFVWAAIFGQPSDEQKAADRQKGYHCFNQWSGTYQDLEDHVVENLRDPDSYEFIGTKSTNVNSEGLHRVTLVYRARNGFGGMTNGAATAIMRNGDCSIVSWKMN